MSVLQNVSILNFCNFSCEKGHQIYFMINPTELSRALLTIGINVLNTMWLLISLKVRHFEVKTQHINSDPYCSKLRKNCFLNYSLLCKQILSCLITCTLTECYQQTLVWLENYCELIKNITYKKIEKLSNLSSSHLLEKTEFTQTESYVSNQEVLFCWLSLRPLLILRPMGGKSRQFAGFSIL